MISRSASVVRLPTIRRVAASGSGTWATLPVFLILGGLEIRADNRILSVHTYVRVLCVCLYCIRM